MAKVLMGPDTLVYPMPVLLVGADVAGKPNFMAVAWGGIAGGTPPTVAVAIRSQRHTYRGIRENMTFSINIPSADMVREADYCGIVSGSSEDKTSVCGFSVFYGKVEGAPLIEQCPVNLECRVRHTLDLGSNLYIIGVIEQVHVSEECLTDGRPDVNKMKPFTYITSPDQEYRIVGEVIAKAFQVGLELREKR